MHPMDVTAGCRLLFLVFLSLLAISPEHVQLPPVGFQAQMICICRMSQF